MCGTGCVGVSAHSDIFLSAETTSLDLPMLDPGGGAFFKPVNNGGKEGFVVKFNNDINVGPLAIELLNFSGKRNGNTNKLNWEIASSWNVDKFILERERNDAFEMITGISANGTQYNFVDNEPLSGINYYRLKMYDVDGRFIYSSVVSIGGIENAIEVEVYPNPATDRVIINLRSDGQRKIEVIAMDPLGRTVMKKTYSESGLRSIDISSWARSSYLFTVREELSGLLIYQTKLVVK